MPGIERVRLDLSKSFYDICGEPPLLNDDERQAYLKLRTAIERALAPRDFFDFQNVAEIACNMVEAQRFKRAQIALITSPAVLAELLRLVFGDNVEKARQVAINYFGSDSKKAKLAADLVAEAGLTAGQIDGHAIVSQSDTMHALDRLVQSRCAANDRKIKEMKKRQKKRAIKSERTLVMNGSNQKTGGRDGTDDRQGRPKVERAQIKVVR